MRAARAAAWFAAPLAALLLALAAAPAAAQRIDPARAAQVKAAYLLNFLRYTQWPEASFENAQAPYRVAILGDAAVAAEFEALAQRAGPIENRGVSVRTGQLRLNAAQAQELRQTHLIYIAGPAAHEFLPALIGALDGAPALVVGDGPAFAPAGGMLGLILSQGRIVFDANPEAIRRHGVMVSAKVLKLAHIVGEPLP